MKLLFVLLTIALLSGGVAACGGSGKGTGSVSQASFGAVASASGPTGPVSTGATSTTTTGKEQGALARKPYETAGVAASRANRQAITALVKDYYAAALAGDGARACSLLHRQLADSVAEDYGNQASSPELRGKTCPVVMSKVFRYRRGQPTSDIAGIEVTGVRIVDGDMAIALLRSPTMAVGETSLQREGGIWRMDQLLGSSLH